MSVHFGLSRTLTLPFLAGAWLIACDGPAPAQDEFWRPWYELPDGSDPEDPPGPSPDLAARVDGFTPGPTDLSSGTSDSGPLPGNCSLAVTVTTASAGGRYSPRNIGAIWVSDGSERFVKTLAVWADKRAKYLKRWNEVTTAAKVPANRTDAISGATKSSHGLRSGTWNCTDTAKMPVTNGAYKVCFELTDYDGQGPTNCVSFAKGPAPLSLTPADSPSFTARKLEFTP